MPNKFSVIKAALLLTNNNAPEADDPSLGDDATDEWKRASISYETALPILLERYPWSFATETEEIERVDEDDEDENPSQLFEYAYAKPSTCLHLESVFVGGNPINYEIVGNLICTDFAGSDSEPLMAKFVQLPDRTTVSHLFWATLQLQVEAGLCRSQEDYGEADKRDAKAEAMLAEARNKNAQEMPRRMFRRSGMVDRRRGVSARSR